MFPSSEKNDEIGWAEDFEFRKSKNLVFVLYRRSDKDKKLVLITVFDANLTGRETPLEITVFVYGNPMSNTFRKKFTNWKLSTRQRISLTQFEGFSRVRDRPVVF